MDFPEPLVPAVLLKRYKRFLADMRLADGSVVIAHCANPGAMTGLKEAGSRCWLSPARNPARKLPWSWELIEVDGALVGINTAHPNAIVAEAIAGDRLPGLSGYNSLRREVRYGRNSRIDILLDEHPDGAPPCYVEVKNVHLKRDRPRLNDLAEFPDSVTARGTKHLGELAAMVAAGNRAVMFYLVQRTDCRQFALAGDIDPTYARAFGQARAAGVEAVAFDCRISTDSIELNQALRIVG